MPNVPPGPRPARARDAEARPGYDRVVVDLRDSPDRPGSIEVLSVEPGDTVIVTVSDGTSVEVMEEFRAWLLSRLPSTVDVAVLSEGSKIEVVRAQDSRIPADPPYQRP
jgi:hypothetical protein